MGTIAKGEITLSPVNDAYTVLVTPATLTITADPDGVPYANSLANAQISITVKRGSKTVAFSVLQVSPSVSGITLYNSSTNQGVTEAIYEIRGIPTTVLNGSIDFKIRTNDATEYVTTVTFNYTVVRETTMLDWIQDWNDNMTRVSGSYILTPKLFVGKREGNAVENEDGELEFTGNLTGVFIGPDGQSAGVYGYYNGDVIFRINETGGMIGGWNINNGGLQSPDGCLLLGSDGTISYTKSGRTAYALKPDGTGSLAYGAISWTAAGSASFNGKITAASGMIGAWNIGLYSLYNGSILLNSSGRYIGVCASDTFTSEPSVDDHLAQIKNVGGVRIHYTSQVSFGIEGWVPKSQFGIIDISGNQAALVFSLGYTNLIAGWNFDYAALWSGTKVNAGGNFTGASGDITIGSEGIRGYKWRIDKDGTAAFSGGSVAFGLTSGNLFGWDLTSNRIGVDCIALTANSNYSTYPGLYVCNSSIASVVNSSLHSYISTNGGLFVGLGYQGSQCATIRLRNADESSDKVFLTSVGTCRISCWSFDLDALYRGKKATSGFTTEEDAISIGTTGIRGYKWRLESDGSGALAGGSIKWTATDGSLEVSGKITASSGQIGGWTINSNSLSLGTVNNTAAAYTAASGSITLGSTGIRGYKWRLESDGSGALAGGNIWWTAEGALTLTGTVTASAGKIGNWVINNGDGSVAEGRLQDETGTIILNPYYKTITLSSTSATGGTQTYMTGYGANIALSASGGTVTTQLNSSLSYSTGTSYISPYGIFANLAGIQGFPVGTGYYHYGAIVGLGFANMNKSAYQFGTEGAIVAGVYGRASNTGTAPAFGGYFRDLKAAGLVLSIKYISDSDSDGTSLSEMRPMVISLTNSGVTRTVYLPTDGIEGRIMIVKQMGAGAIRVYPGSGQILRDDNSSNDYYEFTTGQMGIFVFGIWNIGDVTTQVWSVNRFKY